MKRAIKSHESVKGWKLTCDEVEKGWLTPFGDFSEKIPQWAPRPPRFFAYVNNAEREIFPTEYWRFGSIETQSNVASS